MPKRSGALPPPWRQAAARLLHFARSSLRCGPSGERHAPAPRTVDGLASKPSFFNRGITVRADLYGVWRNQERGRVRIPQQGNRAATSQVQDLCRPVWPHVGGHGILEQGRPETWVLEQFPCKRRLDCDDADRSNLTNVLSSMANGQSARNSCQSQIFCWPAPFNFPDRLRSHPGH